MSQQVSADSVSEPSSGTATSQVAKAPPTLKLDSRPLEMAPMFLRCHGFTLSVLRIIRLCQQQHGLRHGDYQRYR